MSLTEKTTRRFLMSMFVCWLRNPDHVPSVYFFNLKARDSPPSVEAKTKARSVRVGMEILEKSDSGVMSREAYVSAMALSRRASSVGVIPPSIILKSPTRLIILDLKTSAGDSSSLGIGRSEEHTSEL